MGTARTWFRPRWEDQVRLLLTSQSLDAHQLELDHGRDQKCPRPGVPQARHGLSGSKLRSPGRPSDKSNDPNSNRLD